jgi:hypothetical protein
LNIYINEGKLSASNPNLKATATTFQEFAGWDKLECISCHTALVWLGLETRFVSIYSHGSYTHSLSGENLGDSCLIIRIVAYKKRNQIMACFVQAERLPLHLFHNKCFRGFDFIHGY